MGAWLFILVMLSWMALTCYLTINHFKLKQKVDFHGRCLRAMDQELADIMQHVGYDAIEMAKKRAWWGPLLRIEDE